LGYTFLPPEYRSTRSPEGRLLLAVLLSLVPLFVRVLNNILALVADLKAFNYYDGDILVNGLMSILPEFICLVIFLVAGFSVPPRRKSSTSRNYGESMEADVASNPPKAF
jgi:hypothetical protein